MLCLAVCNSQKLVGEARRIYTPLATLCGRGKSLVSYPETRDGFLLPSLAQDEEGGGHRFSLSISLIICLNANWDTES